MFKNLSLKMKLLGTFAVLSLLIAGIGVFNIFTARRVSAANETIQKVNIPNLQQLAEMRVTFKQVRLRAFRAATDGLSAEEKASIAKHIDEDIKHYEDNDAAYNLVEFRPGEEELYRVVDKSWDEHKTLLGEMQKLILLTDEESHNKYKELLRGDFVKMAEKFDPAMEALKNFHATDVKKTMDFIDETEKSATLVSTTLLGFTIFFAMITGYLTARSLSNSLSTISRELSKGSSSVANAAKMISDASVESSSATTEQAAALQETVATIDEVSAMVSKNADNAKRSFDLATDSKTAALRGKQAVTEMLASMDEIGHSNRDIMKQTEESNREISAIIQIIGEIGNKTKVINEIVFQTKLLSFNASVEAARAGEHGKGFAVVAEEVGNLAQMSGNAAKEITAMLEESIKKVESTVTDTKKKLERLVAVGSEKVERGSGTARACGDALDEIVRQVGDLNHMVGEISTASREQALGVQEISKALAQIDQAMQQNTTVAEQSAAASEDLTQQAGMLDSLVGNLVSTIEGGDGQTQRSRPISIESAREKRDVKTSARKSEARAPSSKTPSIKGSASTKTTQKTPKTDANQKVIHLKQKDSKPSPVVERPKQVVGGDDFPSEDDPRFIDV